LKSKGLDEISWWIRLKVTPGACYLADVCESLKVNSCSRRVRKDRVGVR
jgi:hypothetical protein